MIPHVNASKNETEDVDLPFANEKSKHVKWYHRVLLNRTLKVVLSLILVALLAPLLIYQFIFYAGLDTTSPDGFSLGSCLVPRSSRIPCGITNGTVDECHMQCCYDLSNGICFHRFPSRFSYIMDRFWAEDVFLKPRIATVPFKSQSSLTNIRLSLNEVSPTHLAITFYNSAKFNITGQRLEQKAYEYEIGSPELNVVINSTQGVIFNTVRGPLIASENIWEIALKLTDESMYGMGEIPIKADTVKIIYNHKGGLSSIPLVYAKINDSYHGLLIDSVNPTEVSFREENLIVIRSITNFGLKFHLFVGPRPVDVMKDVMKYVGFNNRVEYWMLGAHVCSEFSDEAMNITDISDFIREASSQDMPFESHCVKPIVFDNVCHKETATLINEGASLLKNAGKKFVPHVSPYILYESFVANSTDLNETETKENTIDCPYNIEDYANNMLQNSDQTGMYKGLIGDEQVIYPDYENTTAGFLEQLWIYTKDIDGLILENNWPLDESEKLVNETKFILPYFSESFELAFNHTPRWNASKANGEKYLYEHNQYGNSFTNIFKQMTSTPIGASSQWLNGNVYVNRQNVATSWTSLHQELVEAALGGVAGHWLWSTPICGDKENFDSEAHLDLCIKWYLAATYLPMVKIHSKNTTRDPLTFTGTHRSLMVNALRHRLMFAPYFYTTLQEGPLLRPMFYQYPESEVLKDSTSQFNVGNDLLIVPNLHPSQSMVHVVMPPGVWYEMWGGMKIDAVEGQAVTMATTENEFLTLIRGGSIVVLQKDVKLTADTTRSQSNFAVTIALECDSSHASSQVEQSNSTKCVGSGTLCIAPNSTIHLEADGEKIMISAEGNLDLLCNANPSSSRYIQDINIYGLDNERNNYDHMRNVSASLDLCKLQSESVIEFVFVS